MTRSDPLLDLSAEQQAEVDAINRDVDEFLDAHPEIEAILNLPGVYVVSHTIESVPGVMEVTPLQYSFESPVEVHGKVEEAKEEALESG